MPPSPQLSERRLKRYLNNKKLLSLPDDILSQIASYLVPLPPSTPPTVATLKHALSLSQTCQTLHTIVISRLSTLDFLAPSSYTAPTSRTPRHASRKLESFVSAAAPHLLDLRLPHGYVPTDGAYNVVRECEHLRSLALPVRVAFDVPQAQEFFSAFARLASVTLDLPSPSFVLGLCYAPACLKELTFTKLPAEATWYTALSALLITKGANLRALRVNLLCEDTKALYKTALKDSWVLDQQLKEPNQALTRLSAILQRHAVSNELPNLRELDVSTIPDAPLDGLHGAYNMSALSSKIIHFERAIKRAREQHPQPRGLKKLRLRIQSESNNVGIAFFSRWIDPEVEVEVSFPDSTIMFPPNLPDGTVAAPKVKELMLCFQPRSLRLVLHDVNFEAETLRFGNDLSVIETNPVSTALLAVIPLAKGNGLKTLQFKYDIPKASTLKKMAEFLGRVARLVPNLTTLELPADAVFFSACSDGVSSLVTKSRLPIKVLRLYDFRDVKVTMLNKAAAAWSFPVNHISVDGIKQKAKWFLKGLPPFLRMLKRDFPQLEVLYMEQTSVEPGFGDQKDLFQAMQAIDWYEKACRVDASTLRTEIMEWRSTPALTAGEGQRARARN